MVQSSGLVSGGYCGKQQGAALIFALLVSMLLGVFAAFFTYSSKQSITEAELLKKQFLARYHADNEINKSIYAASSLGQGTLEWPGASEVLSLSNWGKVYERDEYTRVSFTDVSARLNLVPFEPREWLYILEYYGIDRVEAQGIVDKIQDWMDSDNFKRVQGMESRQYRAIGQMHSPRNMIAQSLSELRFIPGITEDVFDIINKEASYWGAPERSPLSGSDAMILAYGNQQLLALIKDARAQERSADTLYNSLDGVDGSRVNRVSSSILRIHVEVNYEGAEFTRVAEVNLSGDSTQPFYLTDWQ